MNDDRLEALADRIAELLVDRVTGRLAELLTEREPSLPPPPTIDAHEVARILGIKRDTVYSLADELGAVRLGETGSGRKPRLRFDPAKVEAYLEQQATSPPTPARTQNGSRRRSHSHAELLPIRARKAQGVRP